MRFLVIWEQGGGWGHIGRLAPVARGLLRRGHEVVLTVPDPERVAARLPGARVLPLPAAARPPARPRLPMADYSDLLFNIGWHAEAELGRLTDAWLELFDAVAPAAVVIDHSPTALLAAQARPRPRVLLSTGFTRPPDRSPPPGLLPGLLPGGAPADAEERRAAETELVARANGVLTARGVTPLDHLTQIFARVELDILATWPELDHHGPRPGVEYAGVWHDPIGDRPEWPAGTGPRVFVYLKDFPARAALLHMLRRSGLPVLACLPGANAAARSGLTTGTLRVVEGPVDLAWAAEACGLAVLNAGHGASALLLRAGTPLLQIPLVIEQFLLAHRVVEMGAAQIALPDAPTQIAEGLQRLLTDTRFTRAAEAFGRRHAEFDDAWAVEDVVARIEAVAVAGERPGRG